MRAVLGLIVAAVLWLGAHGLRTEAVAQRADWPRSATMLVVPPVEVVRLAPYRELLADLLWCRLLVYYGSNWGGDGDLSQVEDLLDDIIALDPRFKAVYEWAGFAVTYRTGRANQEEFLSSVRYLEAGMRQFPDDYKYPWFAGTRYYFDLWSKDKATLQRYRERGAQLIEEAMTKPDAPQDIATTAANMRSKLGQQERALDNLRQMILSTGDEIARQKMLRKLRFTDPGLADELARAAAAIENEWLENLPMVPIDFYLLLGEEPSRVIDLRKLATPRDLFGVETPIEEE